MLRSSCSVSVRVALKSRVWRLDGTTLRITSRSLVKSVQPCSSSLSASSIILKGRWATVNYNHSVQPTYDKINLSRIFKLWVDIQTHTTHTKKDRPGKSVDIAGYSPKISSCSCWMYLSFWCDLQVFLEWQQQCVASLTTPRPGLPYLEIQFVPELMDWTTTSRFSKWMRSQRLGGLPIPPTTMVSRKPRGFPRARNCSAIWYASSLNIQQEKKH